MNRPAASAVPITGSGPIAPGPAVYKGLSVREAAGTPAPAVVEVYDNATAGAGTLLAVVSLPAGGSYSEYLVDGVYAHDGIWVEVVSGTVRGSIRVG